MQNPLIHFAPTTNATYCLHDLTSYRPLSDFSCTQKQSAGVV